MFLVESAICRYFLEIRQSLRLRKLTCSQITPPPKKKTCATFATSASFWVIRKRGKHLCPNTLSEKVWNAIQKVHSCTHSGSKLSGCFSGRLNYVIRYYNQKRAYFKLTATDNILIYYKSVWYDLLSKEDFDNEILRTLHIHWGVGHLKGGLFILKSMGNTGL